MIISSSSNILFSGMNEKEKAEAYVRSKCPELMELSFGCVIKENTGGQFATVIRIQDFVTKELPFDVQLLFEGETEIETVATEFLEEEMSIIGHPIQLQHWLRVLEESNHGEYIINCAGQLLNYAGEFDDGLPGWRVAFGRKLHFDMTTGQPATEADYQAFNQIVGI